MTRLAAFAGEVERRHRPGILVDLTRFRMDQRGMDGGWWYEQIVPRYNGAGIEKFAFLANDGTPGIDEAPAAADGAKFPTGYFNHRQQALDRLRS